MPELKFADKPTVTFAVVDLTDAQISGVLSAALSAKWGAGAILRDVNRAQGTLTYDQYTLNGDGYRDWSSAQLHQVSFEIGDNYTVTFGDSKAVIPVTTYEPVGDEVGGTGACFSIEGGEGEQPVRACFSVTSEGRYEKGGYAVYPKSLLFRAGDYPDKNFSMSAPQLETAAGVINGAPEPIAGNVQHTQFLRGRAAFVDKAWTEDGGSVLRGVVRVPLGLDALIGDQERGISMEWNRADNVAEGFALCTNPRITDAALMSLGLEETMPIANTPSADVLAVQAEAAKPGFWERVLARFHKNDFMPEGHTAIVNPPAVTPPAESAETIKLRGELDQAKAEQFAEVEMRAGRCSPAERAGLIASFVQAAQDDHKSPATVSFTEGQGVTRTGSRVDALKARQAQRPANQLTDEVVLNSVLLPADAAGDNTDATAQFASLQTVYDRRRAAMNGTEGDTTKKG